jgi:hypothetical protein
LEYCHGTKPTHTLRASRILLVMTRDIPSLVSNGPSIQVSQKLLFKIPAVISITAGLRESSIADSALVEDRENEIYIDPDEVQTIKHRGKYFELESPFIVDPSPQRTLFRFQAGTSP